MSRGYRVCPRAGCPELIAPGESQCPRGHGRAKNARWSKDRDGAAQARFRAAVLARDGYRCTRCGHHDPSGRSLDAHHVSRTEGVTLCNGPDGCHAKVDRNAR